MPTLLPAYPHISISILLSREKSRSQALPNPATTSATSSVSYHHGAPRRFSLCPPPTFRTHMNPTTICTPPQRCPHACTCKYYIYRLPHPEKPLDYLINDQYLFSTFQDEIERVLHAYSLPRIFAACISTTARSDYCMHIQLYCTLLK